MSPDFAPQSTDLPPEYMLFDGSEGSDLYHAAQAHEYHVRAHEMLEKAELHIPDGRGPVYGFLAFMNPNSWRAAINEVRFIRALHYRKLSDKHASKLSPFPDITD